MHLGVADNCRKNDPARRTRRNKEEAMRYPKATRKDLTAPASQFRVLGVFVDGDSAEIFIIGDFPSMSAAEEIAARRASVGNPVYVYNDRAELMVRLGSWH